MFEISIEQSVLAKAIEYLEPTVGKNTKGLGDNCISMCTTNHNTVELYTLNTVECTALEAIVSFSSAPNEVAPYVDFKRFKTIILSIPANEIISIKEGINKIDISFGLNKRPVSLVGCNNGMIPRPMAQSSANANCISIPKNLVQRTLTRACAIITDSNSAPIYNCIRFSSHMNNIEATALDISRKRTFVEHGKAVCNNPDDEVLVEASKLKKSMKLFEDYNEIEFTMDCSVIQLKAADPVAQNSMKTKGMIDNIRYFCQRISGNFPNNIGKNFSTLPNEFIELNVDDIYKCFTRIKAIEDKTSAGVINFDANNNGVIISMNTTCGNVEEEISSVQYTNSLFSVKFKYPDIMDILKVIGTGTFEIGVLPKYPNNYIVRATGQTDVMFTVPIMAGANAP